VAAVGPAHPQGRLSGDRGIHNHSGARVVVDDGVLFGDRRRNEHNHDDAALVVAGVEGPALADPLLLDEPPGVEGQADGPRSGPVNLTEPAP